MKLPRCGALGDVGIYIAVDSRGRCLMLAEPAGCVIGDESVFHWDLPCWPFRTDAPGYNSTQFAWL